MNLANIIGLELLLLSHSHQVMFKMKDKPINNSFRLYPFAQGAKLRAALRPLLLFCGLLGIISGCGGGGSNAPPPTSNITATLSGTVASGAGSDTDSDSNDPNANYVANDTPALAQKLANPAMLGGYLNKAGNGPGGPSFIPGDDSDFFRIALAANQTITLTIGDFDTGDLDLFLYYDDGSIDINNPDFFSNDIGQTERLTVPQDGDYLIEVYAYSGYSNYALVVGQRTTPLTASTLASTDDFVPGEIIIKFNNAILSASANTSLPARAASLGLQFKTGSNDRASLFKLEDPQNRSVSLGALGLASASAGTTARQFRSSDPDKQLKMDTMQMIKALRKRHDVLYAEPNYIRHALQVPSDNYYDLQWHYPLINLPAAWDISTGSPDVVVAVIDTGVLLNHPDLQGQFSAGSGYDFISNDSMSQDGEPGIDANSDDPGDSALGSSSFHGTHVAGTVAAATSFGAGGSGAAGVAPGVKIMPIRVLGKGGGTDYDILQGVRYAAGLSNDSGTLPPRKADVINLSLGGPGASQAAQDVFTQARNAGAIIIAAAGNSATSAPSYPAAYIGVVSVSAVDINKQLTPYSNFGTSIDVAAPGGDNGSDANGDGYPDGVLSAAGDDSGGNIDYVYKFFPGTSMASPHVAGVVALMKSIHSNLTPDDVDNLLNSGLITKDLGLAGRDNQFGHGLIDARKAVDEATRLASGIVVDTPFVSASPASLNFGNEENGLPLSVFNGGSGELTVTSVTDDATWLTITSNAVDTTSQLGRYQLAVDRSGLAAGIYTANITINSSANTITLPVILQVAGQGAKTAPDAGYHYILLIDADTNAALAQQAGNAVNGMYHFQFDNVLFSGTQRYQIIAGTDRDNDGFVCDAGEACGAYLSRDQPKIITASDTHTGLNFTSGFSIGLQSLSAADIPARDISIRRLQTKQVSQP